MDPIDFVLSVLPTLSEKEKQRVRDALGMKPPTPPPPRLPHPCLKGGHKFKYVDTTPRGWFSGPVHHYLCERCGLVSQVYP